MVVTMDCFDDVVSFTPKFARWAEEELPLAFENAIVLNAFVGKSKASAGLSKALLKKSQDNTPRPKINTSPDIGVTMAYFLPSAPDKITVHQAIADAVETQPHNASFRVFAAAKILHELVHFTRNLLNEPPDDPDDPDPGESFEARAFGKELNRQLRWHDCLTAEFIPGSTGRWKPPGPFRRP